MHFDASWKFSGDVPSLEHIGLKTGKVVGAFLDSRIPMENKAIAKVERE